MNLLSQRNVEKVFILLSVLLLVVVGWLYVRGKKGFEQPSFQSVNGQMSRLIVENNVIVNSSEPASKAASTPAIKTEIASANTPIVTPIITPTSTPTNLPTTTVVESESSLLNLNTATMEQLDELPGIGASKAKAIIDYRQTIGKFTSLEQLLEVKGIGDKMLAKLTPFIVVSSN